MSNHLAVAYPEIGARLGTMPLSELPTPVSVNHLTLGGGPCDIALKHDDVTAPEYGGNKIRKLEYVLHRANERGAKRIATFGAIGSNHAVATALCAERAGFSCTCFLSHQSRKPGLDRALRFHQQHGTEVVRFGGSRAERVQTMRKYLQGRNAWVIPVGGSSWLGAVGFVNAGLELAAQIDAGELPRPGKVYVALGTMGTAVGLALGFALAGLDIVTQGIRVTEEKFASRAGALRLIGKTATLLHSVDPSVPEDLASRTRLNVRDEFFGSGYGESNEATERAIETARNRLGVSLESTYTGKAMAALLHDVRAGDGTPVLFWNTYNSRPLPVDDKLAPDFNVIPADFARYFD